jgi:UDP-glucose 4-epimerase
LPKVETQKPWPLSPYAVSKLAGEHYCQVFYRVYGLETIILRYFNVFGYNQDPYSTYSAVIPKFISCMSRKESPTIFGDGFQSRDFTFVSNVVEANLKATESGTAVGEIINVASGRSYTLLDLIAKINSILGFEIEPVFDSPKMGEIKHSLADVTKANKLLDYCARVDFEEGLRRTLQWMKS